MKGKLGKLKRISSFLLASLILLTEVSAILLMFPIKASAKPLPNAVTAHVGETLTTCNVTNVMLDGGTHGQIYSLSVTDGSNTIPAFCCSYGKGVDTSTGGYTNVGTSALQYLDKYGYKSNVMNVVKYYASVCDSLSESQQKGLYVLTQCAVWLGINGNNYGAWAQQHAQNNGLTLKDSCSAYLRMIVTDNYTRLPSEVCPYLTEAEYTYYIDQIARAFYDLDGISAYPASIRFYEPNDMSVNQLFMVVDKSQAAPNSGFYLIYKYGIEDYISGGALTKIPGCTFGIYSSPNPSAKITTYSNTSFGTVNATVYELDEYYCFYAVGIEGQTFYLKEESAPAGYDVDPYYYEFSIPNYNVLWDYDGSGFIDLGEAQLSVVREHRNRWVPNTNHTGWYNKVGNSGTDADYEYTNAQDGDYDREDYWVGGEALGVLPLSDILLSNRTNPSTVARLEDAGLTGYPNYFLDGEEAYCNVVVNKASLTTGSFEPEMEGTVYGLYANETVKIKGVTYNAGDLIAVAAVDSTGVATFEGLRKASYYVKELYIKRSSNNDKMAFYLDGRPTGLIMGYQKTGTNTYNYITDPIWTTFTSTYSPVGSDGFEGEYDKVTGYYADDTSYPVTINNSTPIVNNIPTATVGSKEKTIKGEVIVNKVSSDTLVFEPEMEGTLYGLYTTADTKIDSTVYPANTLIAVSAVDSTGVAKFEGLPYATYTVKELYVKKSGNNNKMAFFLDGKPTGVIMGYQKTGPDTYNYVTNPLWTAFTSSYTAIGSEGFEGEYPFLTGYFTDESTYTATINRLTTRVNDIPRVELESSEDIVKGKLTFYKYETDEISGTYLPIQGAGFTIYKLEELSKYSPDWIMADGKIDIAAVRADYLSPNAGATYDANGNLIDEIQLYDFSGEGSAVATVNCGTSSPYYADITDGLARGVLEQISPNHYRTKEIFSTINGEVTTPYLPYGQYIIVETTTPKDHEQILPFVLELYKDNGRTLVSQGITEDTERGYTLAGVSVGSFDPKPGASWEAWYGTNGVKLDKEINMRIYIYKTDSYTEKTVLNPTAIYQIYRIEELKLTNGTIVASASDFATYQMQHPQSTFTNGTDKNGNSIYLWSERNFMGYSVPYESRVLGGVWYKCQKIQNEVDESRVDTFKTKGIYYNGIVTDCYLETQQLDIGRYLAEEVEAPVGYYNDIEYYITFKITTERTYSVEATLSSQNGRNYYAKEKYYDDEVYGVLDIYKQGEVLSGITKTPITDSTTLRALNQTTADTVQFDYEKSYVANTIYKIVAAEDITTLDCQYEKDSSGQLLTDAEGNYIPTTWFKKGDVVALLSTGDGTAVPLTSVIYDGTSASYAGNVFYGESSGTYNTFATGHPIVKVSVSAIGQVHIELPIGKYTVEECLVPNGLTVTSDTADIVLAYKDQFTRTVTNSNTITPTNNVKYDTARTGETGAYAKEGLVFTNDRVKTKAALKKTDTENYPIEGVIFALYSPDDIFASDGTKLLNAGDLIDIAISNAEGYVNFNADLPIGLYKEDPAGRYNVATRVDDAFDATFKVLGGFEEKTGYSLFEKTRDEKVLTADISDIDILSFIIANSYTDTYFTVTEDELYDDILHQTKPSVLGDVPYGDMIFKYESGEFTLYRTINCCNTGNYYINEIYTDKGIFLEDTDYYESFHLYYKTDGMIDSLLVGTMTKAIEAVNVANELVRNKLTEVLISKRVLETTESLEGAEFVLKDSTGATVKQYVSSTSDEHVKGLVVNENLPSTKNALGTYVLREVSAPSGYSLRGDGDTYFCLAMKKDSSGALIPYSTEVYVWRTEYDEKEEDSTVASGEYDGKLDWRLNSLGELEITLKPGITGYQFLLRNYDASGALTSPEMPWETELKSNGITLTRVYLADGISFSLKPDKSSGASEYFDASLFVKGTYKEKIVVKTPVAEGWYLTAEDGKVVVYNETLPDRYVPPARGTVQISKILFGGTLEVDGAQFTLFNSKDEPMESWVSTNEPHIITGLTIGETYRVEEVWAPEGISKTQDVTFKVNDAYVTKVEMVDDYSKASFIKVDLNGNALKGAVLSVVDNNTGQVMDTWVSDGTPHKIVDVLSANAVYKLVELEAPNGYKLAEPVVFTLNKSRETTYITMKDAPDVPTSDPTGLWWIVLGSLSAFVSIIVLASTVLILKRR